MYIGKRQSIIENIKNIDSDISNILLYGGDSLKSDLNQKIILSVIKTFRNISLHFSQNFKIFDK